MTPYVFFLDIDDTIFYKKDPEDKGRISPRVRKAMQAARDRGHFVYINTGRAPSYLDEMIRSLPVDGFVCGCGSYAMDRNGKEIFCRHYDNAAILRLARRLSSPGDPGLVIEGLRRIFRYRNSYWVPGEDWILGDTPEEIEDFLKTDRAVKVNICQDTDPALLPLLEEDFRVIHHPAEHYTECCIKGCSKASGMEAILARHGLDVSRSVAIGDSENDLDMIRAAGIGIVMGQAREEIKRHADRITGSILEDGAATAIEELIQGE